MLDECEEFGHHCGRCDSRGIKEDAWKNLSVTAIAAENLSVREYITQLEQERDRLRAALDSHVNDLQTEIAEKTAQLVTQASRITELQAALRELLNSLSAKAYRVENVIAACKKALELRDGLPKAGPEGEK